MATSVTHLHSLVARNARVIKAAWRQSVRAVEDKINSNLRLSRPEFEPVYLRDTQKVPLHPAARLRQSKGRWYTTHAKINAAARRFSTYINGQTGVKFDKASFPKSRTGGFVNASTGRAPFASTLRPNLTGGAFPRTAGGYGMGSGRIGGARHFSHTPAAPAQVMQNVSQAIRAFVISGQKVQYDGVNPVTGEKRFKSVTATHDKVYKQTTSVPRATPGSYIDFGVNPTITALTPLSSITGFPKTAVHDESLNAEGLIDIISVDFSRALKELSIVLNDLKKLSSLGDLPITYHHTSLRVHFPGCDARTVEKLCVEFDIQGGSIVQDEDFDVFAGTEIALLFPFAPSKTTSEASFYERPVGERTFIQEKIDWRNMLSPSQQTEHENISNKSETSLSFENIGHNDLLTSSPSGYDTLSGSELNAIDYHSPLEYQGFEGIYRFMEQCDGY